MSTPHRHRQLEEASHWIVTLHASDVSDAELEAWMRWMEADPGNAAAFDDISILWEAAGRLREDALPVLPPVGASIPSRRDRGRLLAWSVAALLLLAAGAILLLPRPQREPDVRTVSSSIGERRQLHLDDGSLLDLDAASTVTIRIGNRLREIQLERGRAFFDVAHDPERPFVVNAGAVSARAIGTRFAVSSHNDGMVEVTVGYGRVRVEAPVVGAAGSLARREAGRDQQLVYTPGRGISGPHDVNAGIVTAWRNGTVIYQSEPLSRVIDDLNRYSNRTVRLQDPSLGEIEVTGLWHPGDIDAWIAGLAASLQLRAEYTSESIVLGAPDTHTPP
jgi:transmembrane sensor